MPVNEKLISWIKSLKPVEWGINFSKKIGRHSTLDFILEIQLIFFFCLSSQTITKIVYSNFDLALLGVFRFFFCLSTLFSSVLIFDQFVKVLSLNPGTQY